MLYSNNPTDHMKHTKRQVNMRLRAPARDALQKLTAFYSLSQASIVERLLERELERKSFGILGRSPRNARR